MAADGPTPRYWFPAKRYGWGWGFPVTWQGWIAMFAWLATVLVGTILIAPGRPYWYVGFVLVVAAVLFAICYVKGEPPRWR